MRAISICSAGRSASTSKCAPTRRCTRCWTARPRRGSKSEILFRVILFGFARHPFFLVGDLVLHVMLQMKMNRHGGVGTVGQELCAAIYCEVRGEQRVILLQELLQICSVIHGARGEFPLD